MTMQVTKGEFDRRVKLLEQKVQQSANKLMNDYKEFVERINSITSDNADFNRYAAIVDRINSCFDTNGQFDGSHIAPLSIETSALSVGQRSQALNLKDIRFSIDEYKNSDTVFPNGNLKITNQNGETPSSPNNYGTLTHYTLFNNAQGEPIGDAEFKIEYNVNNPLPSNSHESLVYIYAELPCTKNSSGYIYSSDNNTATIALDTAQRTVESTYNSDHKLSVLLGTISKRFSKTVDSTAYYYRIVDLNYGLTTINGRLITTGRIEGSTQNSAYFDLDTGEIGGTIKFTSTNTSGLLTLIGGATAQSVTDLEGWTLINKRYYKIHNSKTTAPTGITVTSTSISISGWSESIPTPTESYPYIWVSDISYKTKNNSYKEVTLVGPKYDAGLTTDAVALSQSTTIAGGLILSTKIKVGTGSSQAGIMGISNSPYAFWAGGDTLSDSLPVWIKRNGSAKFGDLNVASNGILSFTGSDLKIKKTDYDFGNPLTMFYNDVNVNYSIISSDQYNTSNKISGSINLYSSIGSAYGDAIVWVSVSVDCGFYATSQGHDYYYDDVTAEIYIKGNSSSKSQTSIYNFYKKDINTNAGSGSPTLITYNVSTSGHFRLSASDLNSSNSTVEAEMTINSRHSNISKYYFGNVNIKVTRIQKLNKNYAENGLSIYNNGIVIYKHVGPNYSLILQGIKDDGIPVSGIRRVYNYERDMTIYNS